MIARFKGQGALEPSVKSCFDTLTITLSGPKGCGKSLVFKILRALLPMLGVDKVVMRTRQSQ